VPPLDVRSKL